jgi:putative lipoprotein
MMRSFSRNLAFLGVGLLLAGAAGAQPPADAKPKATVTGVLEFKNKVSFLPGTMIEVEIREVGDARAPATPLGKVVIRKMPEAPVPFTVPYNPADIVAGKSYVLHARVFSNRHAMYTSGSGVPVITGKNPVRDVRVTMTPVKDVPGK